VVLSTLDPKAFGGYIVSILPLGTGVGFLFRGIIPSEAGPGHLPNPNYIICNNNVNNTIKIKYLVLY